MGGWTQVAVVSSIPRDISRQQLGSKMLPLELELAPRLPKPALTPGEVDSGLVEGITSRRRFVANAVQVDRDDDSRIGRRQEAKELWMVPVSPRSAGDDRLCQKRLTPQGHESCRIEVSRVKRPEPHAGKDTARIGEGPFTPSEPY
jgi:hypothetical protein